MTRAAKGLMVTWAWVKIRIWVRLRVRTLDAGDVALVLGLGGGLLLLGQLVHVQLRVGALELAVPALAAQVALLLRLLRRMVTTGQDKGASERVPAGLDQPASHLPNPVQVCLQTASDVLQHLPLCRGW